MTLILGFLIDLSLLDSCFLDSDSTFSYLQNIHTKGQGWTFLMFIATMFIIAKK